MQIAERKRGKVNKSRRRRIAAAAAILVGLAAANAVANRDVHVTRYSFQTDKSGSELRIVQISDFHNDRKLGDKLIKRTEELEPDIIAITGDFIDSGKEGIPYVYTVAEKLMQIAPVYYVTGNHENLFADSSEFKSQLRELGVNVLEQESVVIGDNIVLHGIDDPRKNWNDTDTAGNIDAELSSLDVSEDAYNILLSHRPEAFDAYSDFDLVLSGHAHGGQFRIPFAGGVVAPDQGFFPKYDAGEYSAGKTAMIVSRGIGNSIIPVRINNPPELVVIDIN